MAATKLIVGLVVLLAVVGVVLYFVSDVFKTKVKGAFRDITEWTPENIAKDPVSYLEFCEERTKGAILDLKAMDISLDQRGAKLLDMKAEADSRIRAGTQALEELKTLYKTAKATDAFPVSWSGQDRDEAWIKSQIVSFHRQVEAKKKVAAMADQGLSKIEAQKSRLVDQRARLDEQVAQIATSREMLKVNELSDQIKGQLVDMKGVLVSVGSVLADDGMKNLDDLLDEAETSVDDAEFEKILNG